MTAPLSKDLVGLAAILGISGFIHLGRPEVYEPIMPKLVPAHREVILASGVAEILCAAGLLVTRLRKPAGWASAALLLAVYPANLKMAGDAAQTDSTRFKAIAWARLPLQIPMIRTALKAARG